ncbi:hypothetical protein [Streptomyces sp. NPDC000878]
MATALEATQAWVAALPGEDVVARIIADPAETILALEDRLKRMNKQIHLTFRSRPQAAIIESRPGMGPTSGTGSGRRR